MPLLLVSCLGDDPLPEYERLLTEYRHQSYFIMWLITFGFLAALFVLHNNFLTSKHYLRKLEMEHEKYILQQRHIEILRSYLLQKIEVTRKLDALIEKPANRVILTDEDWDEVAMFLDSAEQLFFSRIKGQYPDLDKEDIRLIMLLRLNVPAKVMAVIYGISEKSVKQKLYVFKAKLHLCSDISLRKYIENY